MSSEQPPKQNTESAAEKAAQLEKLEYVKKEIEMPHVEPLSKLIEKRFDEDGEEYDPQIIEDICYSFLEQAIETSAIYTSEKHKASFPYMNVDTAKVAKLLYQKYAQGGVQGSSEKPVVKVKDEASLEESGEDEGEDVTKGRKE